MIVGLFIFLLTGIVGLVLVVARAIRRRDLDIWLVPYCRFAWKNRGRRPAGPIHLLFCVADHFEPKGGGATPDQAAARVRRWVETYPQLFGGLQDSDGRAPRHTFFYPAEEYEPEYLDGLAELCRQGFGEVEVHLHHRDDTAENLTRTLIDFTTTLSDRHGLLARDPVTDAPVYAFIHGNWALDNSHPAGLCCGVNNELDILRATGCYADYTMPSAPSPTQTRTINSLYYAVDDPARPKSHDTGVAVGSGPPPADALLLIQGPLVLDWSRRHLGLIPRVENGCIQASQPARIGRLAAWLAARVQVPSRPDWFFVKVHAHGASESGQQALLGSSMVEFHHELAARARRDPNFFYHYVTAREMYNLVCAAEAGWTGGVFEALDYRLVGDRQRSRVGERSA